MPDQAVLEGTLECLPGEDIQEIKAAFRAYHMEWSAKDPWFKEHPLKLEWFGLWFEAAEIAIDHPMIDALASAAATIAGARPAIRGGGGSDLRLPILHRDTPTVLFGPVGGLIHSADEYVGFAQVIDCAKILAQMALNWCDEAR